MNQTKSYKISREAQRIAIVSMMCYRDVVEKGRIECAIDLDLEGAEYWADRLASISAAIHELRAAA